MSTDVERQNQIEQKKLEYEVTKITLTVLSIAAAVEVFIVGNSSIPDWLKIFGGLILLGLIVIMKCAATNELKEIKKIFVQ